MTETKSRPLPKHIQIAEAVIREIGAGILKDGHRLPTEKEMAAQYNVAVGTLRKALKILEDKTLLRRVQGSGNYIYARQKVESIYSLFRLELPTGGGLPSAKILNISRRIKPKKAPDFGPSLQAIRIERLRSLNGEVVALEEIWLDGKQAERIDFADVSDSLYHFYQEKLGLVITNARDHVSVAPLPNWTPGEFHMAPGDIAGLVERVSINQYGNPVEFSRNWFDPKRCHYVMRL